MDGKFKVFVIVAIVVLAAACGGSIFFAMKAIGNKGEQAQVGVEQEKPLKLKEISLGDAIMTNIAMDDSNVQHYAKIQISVGVDASNEKAETALASEIEEKSASIRSEVIAAIGEQTFTMLSNTTTGKEKLADEILARLNKLLDTDMFKAVYYEEYFVQ